ncbi:cell wall hydrolase [candidate division KSB1 bacterium]|nr:MAG: cell wall hydrolase [candidate division KSB1 bacterium]
MKEEWYNNCITYLRTKSDIYITAITAFGEARGEDENTIIAVCNVIKNRVNDKDRWYDEYVNVCLQPRQFSCFNFNDRNFVKIMSVTLDNPAFQRCFGVAFGVIRGYILDNTMGATHYHNKDMIQPNWAKSMRKTLETRKLVFYKG